MTAAATLAQLSASSLLLKWKSRAFSLGWAQEILMPFTGTSVGFCSICTSCRQITFQQT